ncbi:hypothetical protein BD408DRAFT_480273 [Parasitella parasitica]|nr:hypothetical protein BD408DRAFT_480273 [Parasitella parasitica]
MDALLIPKTFKLPNPIQESAWQDYLGDADMYAEYMAFFDRQIICHGVDNALKQYFYDSPLAYSVGSHRLPVAHMALGVRYKLDELIGQALAYLATTFQDGSFLKSQPSQLSNSGYLTAHQILVDQTYTYLWKVPENVDDALEELRLLATQMMISPVKGGLRRQYIDAGTGGSLLRTINAIDILYPNSSCPRDILRVQFLNVIHYYIALGRPDILSLLSNNKSKRFNEFSLIQKMIDSNKINAPTMAALFALKEAQDHNLHSMYTKVANLL